MQRLVSKAAAARKEYSHLMKNLMKNQTLTPQEVRHQQSLEKRMLTDVSGLQVWIRSSSGPPRNGWTTTKWRRFENDMKKQTTPITVSAYRGTKLPWITGGRHAFKTKAQLERTIRETMADFDAGVPVVVGRTMSWTKSRRLAQRFASEAAGFEIVPSVRLTDGFIHTIVPPFKAVDVIRQLKKAKLVRLPGVGNEMQAAMKEQELLLPVGTTLVPVSRNGRVFRWTIRSD